MNPDDFSSGSYDLRARVYTPLAAGSFRWLDDARLAVRNGTISSLEPWKEAAPGPDAVPLFHIPDRYFVSPGFIDTHLHAPQIEMIGSYGGHLLEWLERYTFPTEAKFSSDDHATRVADALFPLLLSYGTTTALLFSSIHEIATRRFFESAERSGMRAIIGKTMMDRNAPESLTEVTTRSIELSRELLEEWQGRGDGLLGYAITPRFAPTSTPELLEGAALLAADHPDAWVHTHLSENISELELVRNLFPDAGSYTDVYDRVGLLRRRTVLAHAIHLTPAEQSVIAERQASIAHCPNSNLYLGSGLFPMDQVENAGIRIGLGTDIGAGTTPSMLSAMADAYKVQQVRGHSLDPSRLWRLATIDGATALDLDDRTGSLEPGKDADLILVDLQATQLLSMRTRNAGSIEDLLAGCIFAGDDRTIAASFVRGRNVYASERAP